MNVDCLVGSGAFKAHIPLHRTVVCCVTGFSHVCAVNESGNWVCFPRHTYHNVIQSAFTAYTSTSSCDTMSSSSSPSSSDGSEDIRSATTASTNPKQRRAGAVSPRVRQRARARAAKPAASSLSSRAHHRQRDSSDDSSDALSNPDASGHGSDRKLQTTKATPKASSPMVSSAASSRSARRARARQRAAEEAAEAVPDPTSLRSTRASVRKGRARLQTHHERDSDDDDEEDGGGDMAEAEGAVGEDDSGSGSDADSEGRITSEQFLAKVLGSVRNQRPVETEQQQLHAVHMDYAEVVAPSVKHLALFIGDLDETTTGDPSNVEDEYGTESLVQQELDGLFVPSTAKVPPKVARNTAIRLNKRGVLTNSTAWLTTPFTSSNLRIAHVRKYELQDVVVNQYPTTESRAVCGSFHLKLYLDSITLQNHPLQTEEQVLGQRIATLMHKYKQLKPSLYLSLLTTKIAQLSQQLRQLVPMGDFPQGTAKWLATTQTIEVKRITTLVQELQSIREERDNLLAAEYEVVQNIKHLWVHVKRIREDQEFVSWPHRLSLHRHSSDRTPEPSLSATRTTRRGHAVDASGTGSGSLDGQIEFSVGDRVLLRKEADAESEERCLTMLMRSVQHARQDAMSVSDNASDTEGGGAESAADSPNEAATSASVAVAALPSLPTLSESDVSHVVKKVVTKLKRTRRAVRTRIQESWLPSGRHRMHPVLKPISVTSHHSCPDYEVNRRRAIGKLKAKVLLFYRRKPICNVTVDGFDHESLCADVNQTITLQLPTHALPELLTLDEYDPDKPTSSNIFSGIHARILCDDGRGVKVLANTPLPATHVSFPLPVHVDGENAPKKECVIADSQKVHRTNVLDDEGEPVGQAISTRPASKQRSRLNPSDAQGLSGQTETDAEEHQLAPRTLFARTEIRYWCVPVRMPPVSSSNQFEDGDRDSFLEQDDVLEYRGEEGILMETMAANVQARQRQRDPTRTGPTSASGNQRTNLVVVDPRDPSLPPAIKSSSETDRTTLSLRGAAASFFRLLTSAADVLHFGQPSQGLPGSDEPPSQEPRDAQAPLKSLAQRRSTAIFLSAAHVNQPLLQDLKHLVYVNDDRLNQYLAALKHIHNTRSAEAADKPRFQDVVHMEKLPSITNLGKVIMQMFEQRRKLRPARRRRITAPTTSAPKEITISVRIGQLFNIPVRDPNARPSGIDGGAAATGGKRGAGGRARRGRRPKVAQDANAGKMVLSAFADDKKREEAMSKAVACHIRITLQDTVITTRTAFGMNPVFNEDIELVFHPSSGKDTAEALRCSDEQITFALVDELSIGGSVVDQVVMAMFTVPIKTLFIHPRIQGTFAWRVPDLLHGYTNVGRGHVAEPQARGGKLTVPIQTAKKQLEVLAQLTPPCRCNMFVTLTPPIRFPDPPALDTVTQEDAGAIHRANEWVKKLTQRFSDREYKAVCTTMAGQQVFVTRFVGAQTLDNMFGDDETGDREQAQRNVLYHMHKIARFVSLIPFVDDGLLFPNFANDLWATSDELVTMGVGDSEEHALLLCNLFLALEDIDAWVVLGRSVPEGSTAYVLTAWQGNLLLWNPNNGLAFDINDPTCPFLGIGAVFNRQDVWANVQAYSDPQRIEFDFDNKHHWQPLFSADSRPPPMMIMGTSLDADRLPQAHLEHTQETLQQYLMEVVEDWRGHRPTRWNRHIEKLLFSCLDAMECSTLTSSTVLAGSLPPLGPILQTYDVHGFALDLPLVPLEGVVEAVKQSTVWDTKDPDRQLSLAVKVLGYPCRLMVAWIYFVSTKPV
eukprot:m.288243 g.288243  ORF g.288243 m.288243 type:complete len:1781 (+) comp15799_c0_seq3:145-5487(+)